MCHTIDLTKQAPLVPDLLAEVLDELGFCVAPPQHGAIIADLLQEAGRLDHDEYLYDAPDLESWQPYVLHVSLAARAAPALPCAQDRHKHTVRAA